MIVAVASRKGSPGVTSLSALIGAYWHQPGATRLVLEADPSGGSLAARWSAAHGITWDPGLLSLSTSRQTITPELLPSVAQPVADELWVAAAPPGSDQVVGGLQRLADAGAAALAAAPGLVTIADCGRLGPTSPSIPLARRAALTLLVCRPRLDEVHAMLPAVTELTQAGCSAGLVCVGDQPYEPTDVARSLGIELLGVVPVDHRAAAALDQDGLAAGRSLRRSRLVAAIEELVSRIQARCVAAVGPLLPAPLTGPARGPAANGRDLVAEPSPEGTAAGPFVAGNGVERTEAEPGDRLVAAGMEGPLSPAMMAARASAAARAAPSDLPAPWNPRPDRKPDQ